MAKKSPDHAERSAAIQARLPECDASFRKELEEARAEIFKGLPDSINEIKKLVSSKSPFLRLKAAREHLLLAGLYEEKITQTVNGQLNIIQPHAEKVLEASRK